MSTELETLFWYPEVQKSIDDRFASMAKVVSAWSQSIDEWQGLKITGIDRQDVILDISEALSLDELLRTVHGYNKSTYRMVSGHAFQCWRFQGGQATPGYARLQLECWGNDYARRQQRDLRLEGQAAIYINHVGPYCMVLDPADRSAEEANQKVEENLSHLTDLLFGLIEASQPCSAKVFVDEAHSMPFNAHLFYFNNNTMVIEDLKFIYELWEHGLPTYHIPPLKSEDSKEKMMIFHPWRSSESRRTLHQRFSESISQLPLIFESSVQKVLSSSDFDHYTMPIGTTVLEFPDFMNAFLDRFYLAVLKAEDHTS